MTGRCVSTCWEAYLPDFPHCRDYERHGYSCVDVYCAAESPTGTPRRCAVRGPRGSKVDTATGRCSLFPALPQALVLDDSLGFSMTPELLAVIDRELDRPLKNRTLVYSNGERLPPAAHLAVNETVGGVYFLDADPDPACGPHGNPVYRSSDRTKAIPIYLWWSAYHWVIGPKEYMTIDCRYPKFGYASLYDKGKGVGAMMPGDHDDAELFPPAPLATSSSDWLPLWCSIKAAPDPNFGSFLSTPPKGIFPQGVSRNCSADLPSSVVAEWLTELPETLVLQHTGFVMTDEILSAFVAVNSSTHAHYRSSASMHLRLNETIDGVYRRIQGHPRESLCGVPVYHSRAKSIELFFVFSNYYWVVTIGSWVPSDCVSPTFGYADLSGPEGVLFERFKYQASGEKQQFFQPGSIAVGEQKWCRTIVGTGFMEYIPGFARECSVAADVRPPRCPLGSSFVGGSLQCICDNNLKCVGRACTSLTECSAVVESVTEIVSCECHDFPDSIEISAPFSMTDEWLSALGRAPNAPEGSDTWRHLRVNETVAGVYIAEHNSACLEAPVYRSSSRTVDLVLWWHSFYWVLGSADMLDRNPGCSTNFGYATLFNGTIFNFQRATAWGRPAPFDPSSSAAAPLATALAGSKAKLPRNIEQLWCLSEGLPAGDEIILESLPKGMGQRCRQARWAAALPGIFLLQNAPFRMRQVLLSLFAAGISGYPAATARHLQINETLNGLYRIDLEHPRVSHCGTPV